MSESLKMNITTAVTFGSLACNIFLVAYMLGHSQSPPPPPPPPMTGMMSPPGMGGMMPPPPPEGMPPQHGPHGDGPPPPPGGFDHGANAMGPSGPGDHPPFMQPGALFTPEEMQKDQPFMQEHFDKVRKLRQDFAAQLEKGDVTTDMIIDHFKQTDQVMAELKDHFHEKMIEKIKTMTPEERKKFAQQLAAY